MAKQKSIIPKEIALPLGLGVGSVGVLAVGSGLNPLLPAGVINPVTAVGAAGARFTGPIGTIGFAGLAVKQLGSFKTGKGGI